MCGTVSPFYCCDNSFNKSFVNVFCPQTMSLGIFCFTKSLSNAWKKWLSMSLIQVHLPSPQYSLWRRKKIVLLKFDRVIYICEQMKNSSQHVFGDLYCPTCPNGKCSSLFLGKKSANHNQAYISLCPKRQKRQYVFGIIVSTSQWLIHLLENSFSISFHTPSIYSQARWLSRSPTKLLSSFQTLDQIQLLWL